MPDLAEFTTLRLGGPAGELVDAHTEAELVSAVSRADSAGTSLLLVGGGSNLVVGDSGFTGTVVRILTRGISTEPVDSAGSSRGDVRVEVAAGESWDAFVAHAVAQQWVGVEALSGIPGSVGATPIQNVGAYGQEVAETVESVRVWDRVLRGERTFTAGECGFGYRHSRFKADPGRHVVLAVTFRFAVGERGAPVKYAELARALGVAVGQCADLDDVRRVVLGLRAGKGMVLDPDDHDTWSAGSFFTNPFLTEDQAGRLPDEAPRWPQPDGQVKTSAAWLIEHAGFTKGHGTEKVSLSTKHTLALTNRGGARTADLLALAMEVRDGVEMAFGIRLVNEPVLVGCSL